MSRSRSQMTRAHSQVIWSFVSHPLFLCPGMTNGLF